MIKNHLLPAKNSRQWWIMLVATISIGLGLVFWLPTQCPPPLAYSDSYLFGFNNHLCQLLFVLVLACIAILTKVGGLQLSAPHGGAEPANAGLTIRLILVCLGIAALTCAAFYWLAAGLGGLNDSAYFLDRIHLMDRGQVPYRDFEFIYGSAPLTAAVAMGRLLHISSESGYYLIWGGGTVLGVFLLWLSIHWLELPSGGQRTVFLLVYAFLLWLITGVTLNYSALRYTLPLFAITGFCRLDRNSHWRTRAEVVLFAVAMSATLLGLSPEEGVVYTIAVCLYFPVRRLMMGRPFVIELVIMVALFAGIFSFATHAGTFATMRRLSAGAFNVPVYPGPHILFAFAALFAMVVYLATGSSAERLQSNIAFAVLYSIGMLPGALGRCDTTHVAGYLLPVLICAMLLSWRWVPAWRSATIAFPMLFLILPAVIAFWWSPPVLSKAVLNHLYRGGAPHGRLSIELDRLGTRLAVRTLGEQRGLAKMNAVRSSAVAASVDPHQIFPQASTVIAAPFEYKPNKLSNYQAPWIDEGYFMGTLNILTPDDVERKISELRSHPEEDIILSPDDDFKQCDVVHAKRVWMEQLLLLPWVPQPKRELSMFVPYCVYIQQHYRFLYLPSPATFGYGLMRFSSGG
jgi:hypothetical protein